MLAFIFWHIPREGTDPEDYEANLTAFHGALAADSPEGFRTSAVFRHYALPWAPSSLFVYEDWYLVEDFHALGVLNDAAVEGSRRPAHDAAAAQSAWGSGGVYRPFDEAATLAGGFTYWLSKPDGMRYEAFYDEVGSAVKKRMWRRQMVLGPAPEFCLLSEERLNLEMPGIFESSAHIVYSSR